MTLIICNPNFKFLGAFTNTALNKYSIRLDSKMLAHTLIIVHTWFFQAPVAKVHAIGRARRSRLFGRNIVKLLLKVILFLFIRVSQVLVLLWLLCECCLVLAELDQALLLFNLKEQATEWPVHLLIVGHLCNFFDRYFSLLQLVLRQLLLLRRKLELLIRDHQFFWQFGNLRWVDHR